MNSAKKAQKKFIHFILIKRGVFMKKVVFAAIILCLAAAFPLNVFAASENTHTLDVNGAKMSITMPEGWEILTRDITSGLDILSKYGISVSEFKQNMLTNNIYIDAFNPGTQNEILVMILKDEYSEQAGNLSSYSSRDMDALISQYGAQAVGNDVSLLDWKTVGEYKYLYYEFGDPVSAVQYTTVVNSEWVNLLLKNFSGGALERDEINVLKETVQSVSFSGAREASSTSFSSLIQYPFNSAVLFATLIAGTAIAVLLLRLLYKNKNKSLTVSRVQYNNLNRIGGLLAFMAFRLIIGIIIGLGSIPQIPPGAYLTGYILIIILIVFNLVLLFAKTRLFIAMYTLTDIYTVILYATFLNYSGAVVTGVIEALFILYLFRSSRVAVVYKTKDIIIADSPAEELPAAPAGQDLYRSNTAASLEELKKANPVAYKRNVVAIAAGFRDFAGMISANPDLDHSLIFATGEEDLNKVAAAYGFGSFEEMFSFSLQAINADTGKQH